MKRTLIILVFLYSGIAVAQPQVTDTATYVVPAKVIDGDTIPVVVLDEVSIPPPPETDVSSTLSPVKYSKLVRDVKKVYPYAVTAGIKLNEYNEALLKMTDEDEKKKYMKKTETELKEQFTEDVKNMTLSQGIILLKLIDRQTGNSSYDLVKELRGAVRAIFWQALARIYGANLKVKYDPKGDDKYIEEIVLKIENGTI